ncbi:hypothetical protein GCM10027261_14420 [Geodermatophilus arenarius]
MNGETRPPCPGDRATATADTAAAKQGVRAAQGTGPAGTAAPGRHLPDKGVG